MVGLLPNCPLLSVSPMETGGGKQVEYSLGKKRDKYKERDIVRTDDILGLSEESSLHP